MNRRIPQREVSRGGSTFRPFNGSIYKEGDPENNGLMHQIQGHGYFAEKLHDFRLEKLTEHRLALIAAKANYNHQLKVHQDDLAVVTEVKKPNEIGRNN